jgi:hypothetical protein
MRRNYLTQNFKVVKRNFIGESAATGKYLNKTGNGFDWGGLVMPAIQGGTAIFAAESSRKATERQAAAQMEIERQRLEIAKANQETELARIKANRELELLKAQAETAKSGSKIKAYTIPILVGGVVIIGGIGAYFYFKRKK